MSNLHHDINPHQYSGEKGGIISFIFTILIIVGLGGMFLGWFASTAKNTPVEPIADAVTSAAPDDGDSIGGIVDDAISSITGSSNGAALKTLEKQAESLANQDDGIMHSLRDVVTSEVFDRKGEKAGYVHDIVIHKDTGEARAVIINETGISYQKKLKDVSFNDVTKQDTSGEVTLSATIDELNKDSEFIYNELDPNTISLRLLRSAQILDDQGKVAGEVQAVIYENAEAQAIYFTVIPTLSPSAKAKPFRLPYEAVNIVKNVDGYDVQLNKEQTEAIAKTLFQKPSEDAANAEEAE